MSEFGLIQIYKSRNHLLAILEEIGYDVSNYKEYSIEHVASLVETDNLDMKLNHSTNKKKSILIKYESDLDKDNKLQQLIHTIYEDDKKAMDLMIITKSDPNDAMRSTLMMNWNESKKYITMINISRLQFNILKNCYVPRHEILQEDESLHFYKKHQVSSNDELPVISRFDAVASVICLHPDEICKITRKSKTAIESLYFRVCINQ